MVFVLITQQNWSIGNENVDRFSLGIRQWKWYLASTDPFSTIVSISNSVLHTWNIRADDSDTCSCFACMSGVYICIFLQQSPDVTAIQLKWNKFHWILVTEANTLDINGHISLRQFLFALSWSCTIWFDGGKCCLISATEVCVCVVTMCLRVLIALYSNSVSTFALFEIRGLLWW